MRLQRQSNGQFISLESDSVIGKGGEAHIYAVAQDPWLAAKVYHNPTPERARKLEVMVANPPDDPMAAQGRVSIAWPVDLLRSADSKTQIAGFLMPVVTGMRPIFDFYNPGARRKCCPLFNYLYLHRSARNLCAAVSALHKSGYVIGDVNESNIFVAETALVALVDTDSFQVTDPHSREVYRCTVGKVEFTPPELQGRNLADIDREPVHDLFGLAVLIFQLLMEGTHPFSGIYTGKGEAPSYAKRFTEGHFPYSGKRRMPYQPSPTAPPFEVLHPGIQKLFLQCFTAGLRDPETRPSAQTWQIALKDAEKSLTTCSRNEQHLYEDHLKACPWCERTEQLGGRDPFPSRLMVEDGKHLPPALPSSPSSPPRPPASSLPSSPAPSLPRPPATPPPSAPASITGDMWIWTSLMLALLTMFIFGDNLLSIPWWPSLICMGVVILWGLVGWSRVKKLTGRSKWLALAASGVTAALILALLIASILKAESLPWWLLLLCQIVLAPAALAFAIISWRQRQSLKFYSRWLSLIALGIGIGAVSLVLPLTAILISRGNLAWWLSLIFAAIVGPLALVCGVTGWRQVKSLADQGKWLRSIALGIGIAPIPLSLLVLLEGFIIAGGRPYLTAMVAEIVLIPAALVFGALEWQQLKTLLRHPRWKVIAVIGIGITIVILILMFIAVLLGEILPQWLTLVCAVALGISVPLCGVIGPWRSKMLTGSHRWLPSVALGSGITLILLLLIAAALIGEGLPWGLSLTCAVVLGLSAFISGVVGWRTARTLMENSKWVIGIALGIGTVVMLLSQLVLLEAFMVFGGRPYLTALLCEIVLVPLAIGYVALDWNQAKVLAKGGKWKNGLVLAAATTAILLLLLGGALLARGV